MKRSLTCIEIDSLLNFIKPNPYIPKETADIIVANAKNSLKNQLKNVKIYPELIHELSEQIKKMYFSTLVQPGESVGIITAQSIGEKQTQSNLNSVDWKEKILYLNGKDITIDYIGNTIDSLLSIHENKIEKIPENRTEYLEIKELDFKIPSCDEFGNTNWYKIEAITRHLPVGKLLKIKTQFGREVTVTQSKSLFVWENDKFIPKNGSEVKKGDLLPVTKYLKKHNTLESYKNFSLDGEFGFLVGSFLVDSFQTSRYIVINSNYYSIITLESFCEKYDLKFISFPDFICIEKNEKISFLQKKEIPNFVFSAPDIFLKLFLESIFVHKKVNGKYAYISCKNEKTIFGISFILNYFGIFSFFKKSKDNIYMLFIENNKILFESQNLKTQKNDIILDPIISIEETIGTNEYVYDFTVEETRNFTLFNGLTVRDTFHKAGSSEKQPVVSKFSELLNATNKPKAPSYTLYFNTGNSSISELRKTIGFDIVEITIKKLAKNYIICVNKKPENWYDIFYIIYGEKKEYFTDCISIDIDMNILFEYKLKLSEIAKNIEKEYNDCFCVFSPDCFGKIDIYFDTRNIDLPEEKLVFVTKENCKEIYLDEVVYPILENICVAGLSGITNMFFIKDKEEWFIETENSSSTKKIKSLQKEKTKDITRRFKKVLSYPCIDMSKCLSNNIWDIYHTFGIEATRQYMIDEFSGIMEGINKCHVMILVDKMTFLGTISSISRYTMRNEESGPFGKASFEETLDNFLKAGVYGQEEPTRGVSASIICGKRAPIGTGICELTVDINKLLN